MAFQLHSLCTMNRFESLNNIRFEFSCSVLVMYIVDK